MDGLLFFSFVGMSSLCGSIYGLCAKWTFLSRINIQDYSRIKHLDYKTTKVQVLVNLFIELTESCTF